LEALKELLWCFDEGMKGIGQFAGVRATFLLAEIARLGEPGREALRERRDRTQIAMNGPAVARREAALDWVALNRALGEQNKIIEFFEQLPPDDHRRPLLQRDVYILLAAAQRYADALKLLPYDQIDPAYLTRSAEASTQVKGSLAAVVRIRAREVEVLAGAGQIDDARALAEKLLEIDNSPPARETLLQSLRRAGQPNLLPPSNVKPP
jgi:tetratricopeptide (TPR) repeat protein